MGSLATLERRNHGLAALSVGCFGIGEAIPYVPIEVPPLGFGGQQLLIDLFGNSDVTVDRTAPKLQFQKGILLLVSSGI